MRSDRRMTARRCYAVDFPTELWPVAVAANDNTTMLTCDCGWMQFPIGARAAVQLELDPISYSLNRAPTGP